MPENHNISASFWEREVDILDEIAAIRADIELEVDLGRAEIRYLLDRHRAIERLKNSLTAIRKEREAADDGESNIPTIPPPKPIHELEDPLEENLSLHSGK